MIELPEVLVEAYEKRLGELGVSMGEYREAKKWLRYYIDFCNKYTHPPRDRDSLEPFLKKLTAKRQDKQAQQRAVHFVEIYYALVESWDEAGQAGPGLESNGQAWRGVEDAMKSEIRLRQYSPKTLQNYRGWVKRFRVYLEDKDPAKVDDDDARRYLTHLAEKERVAASTQNQAFNALLFLFRHVLKRKYDLKDRVVRARRTRYIPVVLSVDEVKRLLERFEEPYTLVAHLLYGCGLRLAECLNLRIQCLNVEDRILTVHDGKGRKDRTVPLPQALIGPLNAQIEMVERRHREDLGVEDYAGTFLPYGISRKWKGAGRELYWQWLFPAKSLTYVPDEQRQRRYHMHESEFSQAMRKAVKGAKLRKRVTAHTLRHTFASHLLRANYDIRTIQQLLGHADIRTTMIYTHTVESRTLKEMKSPLDLEIPGN